MSQTSMRIVMSGIVLGVLSLLSTALQAEALLKKETLTVTLYVSEVHHGAAGAADTVFAWIPSDVEARCLKGFVDECRLRDRCAVHALAQKCNATMSRCAPVILAECEKLGITVKNFKARSESSVPTRILESMIVDAKQKQIIGGILKERWKIKPPTGSVIKLSQWEKKHSVKAKVLWELWTNGENFQIQQIEDRIK